MEKHNIEIVISNSDENDTQSIFAKLIDLNYRAKYGDYIIIDISKLNNLEILILKDTINPEIEHLEIEMFFTDEVTYPIFGNDFKYNIDENKLIGKSNKKR